MLVITKKDNESMKSLRDCKKFDKSIDNLEKSQFM